MLPPGGSFLHRSDIRIIPASSNDELLSLHRAEHADLIVTHLDLPGMNIEQLASLIAKDPALRTVQLLLVCANTPAAIEHCSRCNPSAVILRPVNPTLLLARAQQLLEIATRETFRVLISVAVEGAMGDSAFFCKSQDISATGMLIETDRPLPKGKKLTCTFCLPTGTRIQTKGEIVRTIDGDKGAGVNRYGVKFAKISGEDRIALETFVAERSKLARKA